MIKEWIQKELNITVNRLALFTTCLFSILIIGTFLFWAFCVNFVDNYELGYKYDLRTGKIEVLSRTGYFVTLPVVVKVHAVDLRPMQVCINANQRVLNCKLVQFNPNGIELFLSWHGRNDYAGPGSGSSTTIFSEILKSYAYEGSGRVYPFLNIIRELKGDERDGSHANTSSKG